MGKRITLSESEKLNIQNLYQGLLSEQGDSTTTTGGGGQGDKNPVPSPEQGDKKPNPRKYLPISDEFCDIALGKAQVKKGAEGELVKLFQEALIKCGIELPEFGADGNFGNETRDAVREFQRRENLTVDGGIGVETAGKMCELECIPKEICNKCNNRDEIDKDDLISGGDVPDKIGGVDCEKVKECYKKTLNHNSALKVFVKCMGFEKCLSYKDEIGGITDRIGKCGQCPKSYDAMPKINKKVDNEYWQFIQKCEEKGCTEIYY